MWKWKLEQKKIYTLETKQEKRKHKDTKNES